MSSSFELSINGDYAPAWGDWEGIREIVQNALDGQDEGHPLEVSHQGGYLKVTNKYLRLDRSVWILGKTHKRGNDALRGQHGDGLKVGMLALVRAGVEVYIMNGSEKWTPILAPSENFSGETVLTIKTRKMSKRDEDFTVYVKISKDRWDTFRRRILPLAGIHKDLVERIPGAGAIVWDPQYAGDIFCKGIWVTHRPDVQIGYDLPNLSLDRDRRVVDDWELSWNASQVWNQILSRSTNRSQRIEEIYHDLEKGTPDMRRMSSYMDKSVAQDIAAHFESVYGSKARPVQTADEATKLEYYGFSGVVVSEGLSDVLKMVYGDLTQIIRNALETNGQYVNRADMVPTDRRSYDGALRLVSFATDMDLDTLYRRVKAFEFSTDDAPNGIHIQDTGEIRLNVRVLSDLTKTIKVVVHELAHDEGGDGTLDHRAAEESLWEKVAGVLLEFAGTDWLFD